MAIDSVAVDMAFRTALLLTGATKTAEPAVIHGIGSCEDLSHRALLMETVRLRLGDERDQQMGPTRLSRSLLNHAAFSRCSRCCGSALFFEFSLACRVDVAP